MATTAPASATELPLKGRVAIVTGSSRGIGRTVALHLASLGAKLVVNYTSPGSAAQADAVAAEINSSSPGSAVSVRADISDLDQVMSLFDAAEEAFKSPIHVLVNSAGVADSKCPTIANTSVDDFDKIFR